MKNILITGTSSGIGAIIAAYLSKKGYNVIGTSRKGSTNTDNGFKTLKLDVTNGESVENLIQEATKEFGDIDVLINNAGIGYSGPLEDMSIEVAKSQFETNYFGVVRMTQAVLPMMRKNNKGLIINIGSMLGLVGMPFQGHYAASKFALEGFMESLRLELTPFNIQATNICPGDFKSDFAKNRSVQQQVSADYQSQFNKLMEFYEKGEAEGADPIMIAKLVEKLIKKKKGHKIRYVVGKLEQTIYLPVKRVVGSSVFERLVKSALSI